jgi:hypothetical protein
MGVTLLELLQAAMSADKTKQRNIENFLLGVIGSSGHLWVNDHGHLERSEVQYIRPPVEANGFWFISLLPQLQQE